MQVDTGQPHKDLGIIGEKEPLAPDRAQPTKYKVRFQYVFPMSRFTLPLRALRYSMELPERALLFCSLVHQIIDTEGCRHDLEWYTCLL